MPLGLSWWVPACGDKLPRLQSFHCGWIEMAFSLKLRVFCYWPLDPLLFFWIGRQRGPQLQCNPALKTKRHLFFLFSLSKFGCWVWLLKKYKRNLISSKVPWIGLPNSLLGLLSGVSSVIELLNQKSFYWMTLARLSGNQFKWLCSKRNAKWFCLEGFRTAFLPKRSSLASISRLQPPSGIFSSRRCTCSLRISFQFGSFLDFNSEGVAYLNKYSMEERIPL